MRIRREIKAKKNFKKTKHLLKSNVQKKKTKIQILEEPKHNFKLAQKNDCNTKNKKNNVYKKKQEQLTQVL